MRRYLIGLVLLLIACMGLFAIFYPVFAVPSHISLAEEQKQQRETVAERVRLNGGWDALRKQCDRLLKTNSTDYRYYYGNGAALPASFVPLRPRELQTYPEPTTPAQPPGTVEIKFYGMHCTGGYDVPYYALWVWGSSTPANYTPTLEDYRNSGSRPSGVLIVKKLTDRVYAVSSKRRQQN